MTLENQTFVVTGGSSGIGRAVVARLLARGARVYALARNIQTLTVAPEHAARIHLWPCDLADFTAAEATLDRLMRALRASVEPYAGAVLCHGYGDFAALEQFSRQRIERLINTNLTSTILLCRRLLPPLKQQRRGDVVMIGSTAARQGSQQGAVYCASKFGLRGLAQALRAECASSGVRIAIVNPGMVRSPFYDRLAFAPGEARAQYLTSDEVAAMIETIIGLPAGAVIDELNLSPQTHVVRAKSPYGSDGDSDG